MSITAFDLLTKQQEKPFFRFSQIGPVLVRARSLAEGYDLTANDVEQLADAAYRLIEDYKVGMAEKGVRSIIEQFDLPFDPEHPESVGSLGKL